MFHDSNIVKKYLLARMKVKLLVTNVLAVHSLTSISEEIKSEDIYFYWIGTDASNHKAIKVFPFVIQYFTANHGSQYKLLKARSLPNEKSDCISKFCEDGMLLMNVKSRRKTVSHFEVITAVQILVA